MGWTAFFLPARTKTRASGARTKDRFPVKPGMTIFLLSFRFLPGKKRGGREQDVDQFLTALRSVCLQNDGTKTGQESDLSNQRAVCPDAPLRSRLHPSITKITISSVISKRTDRVPLSSGSDCFRPAGSEYRENTRNRVL